MPPFNWIRLSALQHQLLCSSLYNLHLQAHKKVWYLLHCEGIYRTGLRYYSILHTLWCICMCFLGTDTQTIAHVQSTVALFKFRALNIRLTTKRPASWGFGEFKSQIRLIFTHRIRHIRKVDRFQNAGLCIQRTQE